MEELDLTSYVCKGQIHEPDDQETTDILEACNGFIVASKAEPFGPDGKPRMLVINAWMVHAGRNLNGDAFVKEELQQVVKDGLFAPPYAGMIDDDHDFTARGYWYKTSFAFDEAAQKWGILATGAIWAWRYSELADRLKQEMLVRGFIEVSMSVIPRHAELTLAHPEAAGQRTKILHNPVFFTTSLLSGPPGDKYARGKVVENPSPAEMKELKIASAETFEASSEAPDTQIGGSMDTKETAVDVQAENTETVKAEEVTTTETVVTTEATTEVVAVDSTVATEGVVPCPEDTMTDPNKKAETMKAEEVVEATTEPVVEETKTAEVVETVETVTTETAKVEEVKTEPIVSTETQPKVSEEVLARKAAKLKMQKFLKSKVKATETPVAVAEEVATTEKAVVVDTTTAVVEADNTAALEDRRVKGAMAVNVLRFAKSAWNSSESVLNFLTNERLDYAYRVDKSGKVASQITETAGYYEVEALPAQFFVAGTFVEHCIAAGRSECAILAVSGEVKDTPDHPGKLPVSHVDSMAAAEKVSVAYTTYHVKRASELESKLTVAERKCQEIEAMLVSVIEEKGRLADEVVRLKHDLENRIAQAKLEARLHALPKSVKAELNRTSNRDEILQYISQAGDQEWELARRTLALANNHHKSFTELSEVEGKLPVGGGSTNETKTLREFLR